MFCFLSQGDDDDCVWSVSYNQAMGGTKSGEWFPFSVRASALPRRMRQWMWGYLATSEFNYNRQLYDYILYKQLPSLPWTCPLKPSVYNLQRRKKEVKKLRQKYNVPCWVSVKRRKANSFQELTNVSRSFDHAQDKGNRRNLRKKMLSGRNSCYHWTGCKKCT